MDWDVVMWHFSAEDAHYSTPDTLLIGFKYQFEAISATPLLTEMIAGRALLMKRFAAAQNTS
jgi:hypothetical protein